MTPAGTPSKSDAVAAALVAARDALARRAGGARHLYAVVDAARQPMLIPATIEALASSRECLFRGKALENIGDQAPWAVLIDPNEDVLDWLAEDGFGRRWASFAVSAMPLGEFVSHLRRFTMVEDDAGRHLYFRFYDPNVLRMYLPTLDAEQTVRFFRNVDAWLVENNLNADEIVEMTCLGGATRRRSLPVGLVAGTAAAAREAEPA
jgi:hypothetical protein